jgi:hypothetical protein
VYGEEGVPTAEELLQVEKEMQLQETLIKGYQKENERLTRAVKETEQREEDSKRRYFSENEKLNATVNNLKNRIQSTTGADVGGVGGGVVGGVVGGESSTTALAIQLGMELEKDTHILQLTEDLINQKKTFTRERDTQKFEISDLQRQLRVAKDAVSRMRANTKMDQTQRVDTQRKWKGEWKWTGVWKAVWKGEWK